MGEPAILFEMMAHGRHNGFTMVELLLGILLLVGGGGALLFGMLYAMDHTSYLSEFQIAMNAAQGELEMLEATNVDTLWSDPFYANARRTDPLLQMGQGVAVPNLHNGMLTIQIKRADPQEPPALLDIQVAACWQHRGRPIGEDHDCDGFLDVGEDINLNGWVDSPAMVSTRIARRGT